MAKAGRPTKLDPELQDKICKKLRKGMSLEHAAEINGVSRYTIYEWVRRGEERDVRESAPEFAAFANAIRAARSQGVEVLHDKVFEMAMGVRASKREKGKLVRSRVTVGQVEQAKWLLSRIAPQYYAQQPGTAVNVEAGEGNGAPSITIVHASGDPEA